ncbi:hypothetical protein RHSP_83043 [Rhizobium freirei PRF 81]|uniref:Uncharacterized protein n=1 Tax=Rhizobium freirei PRF 81 TaxID=363754 RepID=N6UCH2_9HYPH|nr:hypothetical protein [Rhizobium freirei]ENN87848.1 hypothetical protein RHSP_83043 [Rhizobium freirei PRF 81]
MAAPNRPTFDSSCRQAQDALGQFQASPDNIDRMSDPSLADRLSAANSAMLRHSDKACVFVRGVSKTNLDFEVDRWLSRVPPGRGDIRSLLLRFIKGRVSEDSVRAM